MILGCKYDEITTTIEHFPYSVVGTFPLKFPARQVDTKSRVDDGRLAEGRDGYLHLPFSA